MYFHFGWFVHSFFPIFSFCSLLYLSMMLMISTMIIMIILIHEEIYSLSQQGFKGQFQDWMLIFFTRSPNWSTSIASLASIYLPLMLMSRVVGPQVRASPHSYSPVDPEISNPFHPPTPSKAFRQQLERETSRSRTIEKLSKSRRSISSAAVQSTIFDKRWFVRLDSGSVGEV